MNSTEKAKQFTTAEVAVHRGDWTGPGKARKKAKTKDFTTEEIEAVARGDWHGCEFVDFQGLYQKFGLKRSTAYNLLKEGVIRGVSLRRRGRTRGKRLFDVASVRSYLADPQCDYLSPKSNGDT